MGSNVDSYYSCERPEMLKFIPEGVWTLLDVGCAEGAFGASVKEHGSAREVWGVEPVVMAAQVAEKRLDRVFVETFSDHLDIPRGSLDAITMTDALEHMVDTDGALQLARDLLKPGGRLVLSLPNVQFYIHVYNLIRRNAWDYQDDGILDRTHVRFFTTASATRTLERNGFQIEKIEGLPINKPRGKWWLLFKLFPKTLYWAQFFQFAVVARRV